MRIRKKYKILIVCCLILIAAMLWARWRPAQRFSPSEPSPGSLRLVTWNVGYFALASDKNMRDVDLSRVSDIIKTTQAQVVVLQELGDGEQVHRIARQLGDGWHSHALATGHGEQVNGLLSVFPIAMSEEVVCGTRLAQESA